MFQRIADRGSALGLASPQDSYRSRVWFRKNAKKIRSVNVNRLMDQSDRKQRRLTGADIGGLFLMWYDAKHKDTLPYWDQLPLMIPFRIGPDFTLGYNLHYISPYRRAQLLNALYRNQRENEDAPRRLLNISYGMLNEASRLAWLRPCIKKYLHSNIRSDFMWIQPDEYDLAVMLPLARFVGASPMQVWRDSARKVR